MNTEHIRELPNFSEVKNIVIQIAEALNKQDELSDSVVAVRVIGEFSSGKTRVIREFLHDFIPQDLMPISSREVQTRLPLEITYGEEPGLSLVKGTFGWKNRTHEKTLHTFPLREELSAYSANEYSLHLTIPEKKFILPQGDGYAEEAVPMRFCLIDTLGWNSEDGIDLDSDDYFSDEWENMALIYVTQANRVDSQFNKNMIAKIVQAFENDDLKLTRQTLPMSCIITHCDKNEAETLKGRMQNHFDALMEEHGIDKAVYPLQIFALEFDSMEKEEKQAFRKDLWGALLCDTFTQDFQNDSIARTLQSLPEHWHILPYIKESLTAYERFMYTLDEACHEGHYVRHMTRRRLDGLSPQEMCITLRGKWLQQIKVTNLEDFFHIEHIDFPKEHPLSQWWHDYWMPNVDTLLHSQKHFFETMLTAIDNFTPEVSELAVYFIDNVSDAYLEACMATHNSFGQLCQTVNSWDTTLNMTSSVATLLSLSLMQTRYVDTLCAVQQGKRMCTGNIYSRTYGQ